ncbi:MAG: CBS domain-containing protein, partial [Spirochaetales bacterium]
MQMATVPINADSSPGVVLELLYSIKVKDAMTRDVMTASPASKLRDVQKLMRDNAITGIPILEEGRLLGIVSIGDVISALDSGTMDRSAEAVMSSSVITLDEEMPLSFAVTYFDRYKFGRFPVLDSSGRLSG